uniref:Uncharacterized protein n=1 Tax=Nelumbo nucifera TaxID=4432 RepID=A0A822XJY8_NELNU|nr:TPA_asm: hypothetical protein HUJ06_020598 [Nelumbo nucifera]
MNNNILTCKYGISSQYVPIMIVFGISC